jgi:hypothetical protein
LAVKVLSLAGLEIFKVVFLQTGAPLPLSLSEHLRKPHESAYSEYGLAPLIRAIVRIDCQNH